MGKTSIPEHIKELLYAKTAGVCQYPGCNVFVLEEPLTKNQKTKYGQIAHIIADSPEGPRGNKLLSKKYAKDINNLMVLCLNHHKLIDNGDVEGHPIEKLKEIKSIAENNIAKLVRSKNRKQSLIVCYTSNIGIQKIILNNEDIIEAVKNNNLYPVDLIPTELGINNNPINDNGEKKYWEMQVAILKKNFKEKIESRVKEHISLFALAPQPLLIYLGTLLSDKYIVDVYQLKREPKKTWCHLKDYDSKFKFIIKQPQKIYKNIAINVSISGKISDADIKNTLKTNEVSIWTITINSPNNDCIRSDKQIMMFRNKFRELFNLIKDKHGACAEINLFPAMPISLAIEIGRVRMPKADLPLIIYDRNQKNFFKTISIK